MWLRRLLLEKGIHLNEIADAMGLHEVTIYRWLRHELDGERKTAVESALSKIINGEKA